MDDLQRNALSCIYLIMAFRTDKYTVYFRQIALSFRGCGNTAIKAFLDMTTSVAE